MYTFSSIRLFAQGDYDMFSRLVIITFMIIIIYNLGRGLYFLFQDAGHSNRTVKSLTWRIGLSVFLFILLFIGFATGMLQPHSLAS